MNQLTCMYICKTPPIIRTRDHVASGRASEHVNVRNEVGVRPFPKLGLRPES